MSQSLAAVAGLLPETVLFRPGGVVLPVLLPIVGMLLPPLAGAIAADLSIFRIGSQFYAAVVGTPPALTLGQAANFLTRLERGRLELALAISAVPQVHTGVVASCNSRIDDADRFRNFCRVGTASPPMGAPSDYISGETAVVSNRG